MIKVEDCQQPLEMLYRWERESGSINYLHQPINRQYRQYTWAETASQVRRMAAYLRSLELAPGSHIAIISKNCAHWLMADFAIWMAGHVSVPLYPNITADAVRLILEHSESKAVFVGKLDNWPSMKPGLPTGIHAISLPQALYNSDKEYPDWDDIVAKTEPMRESPARGADDLATLIYTSGTTGMPKGAMHCFRSFSFLGTNVLDDIAIPFGSERFFSYLPLSHCAERALVETLSLYVRGHVYFAESLDTFIEDLRYATPNVFLAVPRIWTKFYEQIGEKLPEKKLNLLLSIPGVNYLIRKKVQKGLGLHEAKILVTGAAPIPVSLLKWFDRLGLTIQEAYGQTENMAYSHFTRAGKVQYGWIGQPWPGVDQRLSDQGEIQLASPATMTGYYREPDKTAEAMCDDGFLRTGDKGEIDGRGYLRITGRMKDLFKTAKGKYVAPSPIEMQLACTPHIENVCVVGSGLPQPIALMTLSELGKQQERSALTAEIAEIVHKTNAGLDSHERLKRAVLLDEPWTIENDILTPTLKVKRNVVEDRFGGHFEEWYNRKDTVVWGA